MKKKKISLYNGSYTLNELGLKISDLAAANIARFLKKIRHQRFDPHDIERVILRAATTQITFAWLKDCAK